MTAALLISKRGVGSTALTKQFEAIAITVPADRAEDARTSKLKLALFQSLKAPACAGLAMMMIGALPLTAATPVTSVLMSAAIASERVANALSASAAIPFLSPAGLAASAATSSNILLSRPSARSSPTTARTALWMVGVDCSNISREKTEIVANFFGFRIGPLDAEYCLTGIGAFSVTKLAAVASAV